MKPWGQHLILNLTACNKRFVTDREYIRVFVRNLVNVIEMKAYGEPLIEHFAENDLAGWSMVQLIETSTITAHFVDLNGDTYLDIFSCKEFDVKIALDFVQRWLEPKHVEQQLIFRSCKGV